MYLALIVHTASAAVVGSTHTHSTQWCGRAQKTQHTGDRIHVLLLPPLPSLAPINPRALLSLSLPLCLTHPTRQRS